MVMPTLPMFKVGGLVLRTLTKPLAKGVKTRAKIYPRLNAVCHSLGQLQHRMSMRIHMGYRGISNYTIKNIPADQAVDNGADLIGEALIFSVALGVASYEYARSTAKSKETERKNAELKAQAEKELEERFEHLEMKVIWLETKLAEMGHILEQDIEHRLVTEARKRPSDLDSNASPVSVQSEQQSQRQQQPPQPPQRRRQTQNVHVGVTIDDEVVASASISSKDLWRMTYESVAALFK